MNKFGDLGGFDALLKRFQTAEPKLTISLVVALLKPWGLSHAYLTASVIEKYFAPIIVRFDIGTKLLEFISFPLGIRSTISRSSERK